MERKGLNTGITKVMTGCTRTDKIEEKGKWPCNVCKKEVGNNSVLSICKN